MLCLNYIELVYWKFKSKNDSESHFSPTVSNGILIM